MKHFEATSSHNRSVDCVEKSRYVEAGYVEDGYFADPLLVYLTQEERRIFGQQTVEAADLAKQVYDFWKARLSQP
jgi:hypothetical protein